MAEPTIARPNAEYRTALIRLPALLGVSSGSSQLLQLVQLWDQI